MRHPDEVFSDEHISGLVPRLSDAVTALRAVATGEAVHLGWARPTRVLEEARHALLDAQEVLRSLEIRAYSSAALETRVRRYQKLVERCADSVIQCAADGTIKDATRSLEATAGYALEQQLGHKLVEFVHPDDERAVTGLLERATSGQAVRVAASYRMRGSDGSWRWMEATATDLLADSDLQSIVVMQRDVTERVRAEEALRVSEARYRTGFEIAPEAIFTLDVERGNFVELNDNTIRLLGYSRDELLELGPVAVSPLLQPDGRTSEEAARDYIGQAMRGEHPIFEWTVRSSFGEEIPLELRLVRFPDAVRQLCRASAVDIRARKAADDARTRSAALELLSQRCTTLAAEFAILADASQVVLSDGDIVTVLAETLAGCLDAGGVSVGALYLLDAGGAFRARTLGRECGWEPEALATFFGQEPLLRRIMAWGIPTELPSAIIPETLSEELLKKCGGSCAVIIPLQYKGAPLGACVLVSRTRGRDQADFRSFATGVGSQITQVLALASALADKETLGRRAAEQAKLLRLVLDSMADGVLVVDREHRVLLQNRATMALAPSPEGSSLAGRSEQFGLYRADGQTPLRSEDRPLVRAANGERIDDAEICLRPPGSDRSTLLRVTGRPLVTDEGELRGGMVVFRDITEQKRAEQEILESRSEWQSLVENAPDFILNVDRDGIVRFINRVAPGFDRDQVVGTRLGSGVPPEEQRKMWRAFQDCITKGERTEYEIPAAGPGETMTWYSSVLGPIRLEGRIVGAVIIARDITEKKLTEAQLIESDRMASLGALSAGVAHEVNNPLSSLFVNLNLASRDAEVAAANHPQAAALSEELRDAREAAERVRQIVLDLRIFSGRQDDRRSAVDVEELLESTLRMAMNEIRHRARLVRNYVKVPLVRADESRLGQVFLNLVLNATRAIPEGNASRNEIRVSTGVDPAGRVVVRIADTGEGIEPDAQGRVFTPFFTTKAKGFGTGLGLSICKRLVEELGGEIGFQSQLDQGTEFSVFLPAVVGQAGVSPDRSAGPAPQARRGRVLVIDDDPAVSAAIKRVLSPVHDLIAVDSGARALEVLLAGERFDVILCDVLMPQMSGIDLYAEVSRVLPEQATRFVFATGGVFTHRAQDFLDSVSNPRLEKPFNVQTLKSLIAGLVT